MTDSVPPVGLELKGFRFGRPAFSDRILSISDRQGPISKLADVVPSGRRSAGRRQENPARIRRIWPAHRAGAAERAFHAWKAAASCFRLIVAAVRQDWIFMLPGPRRAAQPVLGVNRRATTRQQSASSIVSTCRLRRSLSKGFAMPASLLDMRLEPHPNEKGNPRISLQLNCCSL